MVGSVGNGQWSPVTRGELCPGPAPTLFWPHFCCSLSLVFIFPLSCIVIHACMRAKMLQSRPTLCDPTDHSLPGSSVYGILQARILEWVAMPSSW